MTTERIANHVKFAYWVPNVSGGLVTSDIEQRTDWSYEYNAKPAQTAENNGFEYALSQVRYEASYCGKSKNLNRIRSIRRCWCPPECRRPPPSHAGALAWVSESLRPAQERS